MLCTIKEHLEEEVPEAVTCRRGRRSWLRVSDIRRHVLKPVRNYDPNSAEQVLYRLAESQFLRMLTNRGGTSTISQIE
jgi:hypothetical protein